MDWQKIFGERLDVIRSHWWTFALASAFGAIVAFGASGWLFEREIRTANATIELLQKQIDTGVRLPSSSRSPIASLGLPYEVSWPRTALLLGGGLSVIAASSLLWPRRAKRARDAAAPQNGHEPLPAAPRPAQSEPRASALHTPRRGLLSGGVDLEAWAHVDPLTLRDAACLWVERDPTHMSSFALDGAAAGILKSLAQAAERGLLRVEAQSQTSHARTISELTSYDSRSATRASLAKYAASIGKRPAFLAASMQPDEEVFPPEVVPEAVLWLEDAKFTYHGDGERLTKGMLHIDVRNTTAVQLDRCRVSFSDLVTADGHRIVPRGSNIFNEERSLNGGGMMRLIIATRDLKDVVRRPPWKLITTLGETTLPLSERITMSLTLASNYDYPTKVALKLALRPQKGSDVRIATQGV